MARTVVLQVKGAPKPGVNPFAKKKGSGKPGEQEDPKGAADAQEQDPANAADPSALKPAADKEDLLDGGADEQLEDDAVPGHEPDPTTEPDPNAPPDPSADPNADPNADPTKDPKDPNADEQPEDQADTIHPHEWAGDVYEDGDETDPQDAFASFQGQSGEQAWLDRADDGTITGWVRDADGTVLRYSDDNAWATDVDDAGMQQAHGPQGQPQPGQDDPMQQGGPADPGGQQTPPAERSLFDDVTKKDAAGGLVVVDQSAIAAQLAALGQPHLQAWAKQP